MMREDANNTFKDAVIATIEKAFVLGDDRPIKQILKDIPEIDMEYNQAESEWVDEPIGWRCLKCGTTKLSKSRYCPDCGAKMKDEEL